MVILLVAACGRVGYEQLPASIGDSGAAGGGDASVHPGSGGVLSSGGRPASGGAAPAGGTGGQATIEAGAGGSSGAGGKGGLDAGESGGTPNDAAPDGSFWNGTRYQRIATPGSFESARAACAAAGMRLVEITSQAEHDHVWRLAQGETTWIGGTDEGTEGEWFWLSGAQFWTQGFPGVAFGSAYANWLSGVEPQNSAPGEHCATLFAPHLGLWADEPCSDRNYPAICQGVRPP